MIRILIADDHAMVRAGLRTLLSGVTDMRVVADASTGDEALRLLRAEEIDVLLLDLDLPGKSGMEVLQEAKRLDPLLKVLIVSMMAESAHATRMLKAGASGYIMKDCEQDELLKAVRRVAVGKRYISTQLAESLLAQHEGEEQKPPHAQLSEREYEIFSLIAAGKALIDIAGQLHISEKTVSTHRARILEKMGMESNAALIKYAVLNGLVR